MNTFARLAIQDGLDPAALTFGQTLAHYWMLSSAPVRGIELLDTLWTHAAVRHHAPQALAAEIREQVTVTDLEAGALRQRVHDKLLNVYGNTPLVGLVELLRTRFGLYSRWTHRPPNLRAMMGPRIELDRTWGRMEIEEIAAAQAKIASWRVVMRSSVNKQVLGAARGYSVEGKLDPEEGARRKLPAELSAYLTDMYGDGLVSAENACAIVVTEYERSISGTSAGFGAQLVSKAVASAWERLKSPAVVNLGVVTCGAQDPGLPAGILTPHTRQRLATARHKLAEVAHQAASHLQALGLKPASIHMLTAPGIADDLANVELLDEAL